MPCCVLLKNSGEIIILKSAWCEKLNKAESRIHGCRPWEMVKIFYSPDKKKRADFRLQIMKTFHHNRMACYYGYVMKICGIYKY